MNAIVVIVFPAIAQRRLCGLGSVSTISFPIEYQHQLHRSCLACLLCCEWLFRSEVNL